MAETVVSILIDQLVPLLMDEIKLLGGVPEEVGDIRDVLQDMKAFLKDADRRQKSDERLKAWVKQVQEVVYDTEYVVEDFLLRLRHHPAPGFTGLLRKCARFIRLLRARHRIASEIQQIKKRVCNISRNRKTFALEMSEESSNVRSGRSLTALLADESDLVGLDKPRAELIKKVIDRESRLTVISLMGMGGIGKTTLSKKVYDDIKVRVMFRCCAWITVSQTFKVDDLFRSLLKQFSKDAKDESLPEQMESMDYIDLGQTLKQYLQEKKYLAVLDDVWSVGAWEQLKCVFPKNLLGSRIIVTTRRQDVVSPSSEIVVTVQNLQPLPQSEAWMLFCKKTFLPNTEGRIACPPELENHSQSIVRKCGGLPLAIVTIGGLLSRKPKTPIEWEKVQHSLATNELNDGTRRMGGVLWLSYEALPYDLKACFLYFSLYPEDYQVKRASLIRLWIAEGFVMPRPGKTLEDVAEDNLSELVDRSLVEAAKFDSYGRVKRCHIHDLMRELILSKAKEENFCKCLGLERSDLPERIHRLAVHDGGRMPNSSALRYMRSLLMFGPNQVPSLLIFPRLKVLNLKQVVLNSFPEEVVKLLHLKYLNLRRTNVQVVPNSISKLQNLQTLDLKYTKVSELPEGVLKLQNLRHIHMFTKNKQGTNGGRMPTGMGRLINLQKIDRLRVGDDYPEQLKELGKLTQLRKLVIAAVKMEQGKALCASIKAMKCIQSVAIIADTREELLDIESMSIDSPLLRHINLQGRLEKFPDFIVSLKGLVKITLRWSMLEEDPFRVLQSLPLLEDVSLRGAYDGDTLHCGPAGFQKLKMLVVAEFRRLTLVILERGAMPKLQTLAIRSCEKLDKVPVGIENLAALEKLSLRSVSEKFLESIKKDTGKDWDKVKHVTYIKHNQQMEG